MRGKRLAASPIEATTTYRGFLSPSKIMIIPSIARGIPRMKSPAKTNSGTTIAEPGMKNQSPCSLPGTKVIKQMWSRKVTRILNGHIKAAA